MYDFIKGIIADKQQNSKGTFLVLENSGIGYNIEVLPIDFSTQEINNELKLYTILLHKEDMMHLCGFVHKENRDIFKILTSVSGVGTKMALTLLNEFSARDLISFVVNENFKALTKAKGVGIKLAQKIILELKDKLITLQPAFGSPSGENIPSETSEVQDILLSLGYSEEEITTSIKQAITQVDNINNNEELLRITLQILSA